MRKTIGLIGVGSLGGYVAKSVQRFANKIYGIDPDIVKERNLRNSIYTRDDVGKPKVAALKKQITECEFAPVQNTFENVDLDDVDSLIDCRDVVNRNIRTDSKFLVVGKNLQINCEEPTTDDDISGSYMIDLEKYEISQAGRLAAESLLTDGIKNLQEKKMSINIPLSTKSVIREVDFLVRQYDKPIRDRNIEPHIYEDLKKISDSQGCIKTTLCKVDERQRITICEPRFMYYPEVINILNNVVLKQGGTYSIDIKNRVLEICNPFLTGGA